jgi:NAD-dependent deacetylase
MDVSRAEERTTQDVADALRGGGPIAVVTGAGVSLASGIPTFRGPDPGAVWTRDVTALGTHRYFREDPAGSWRWYLARFDGLPDKVPNDAHRGLAALEDWQVGRGGTFTLVTQNVDRLHEAAGSRTLYKVHGSCDRVRCSAESGCEHGAPRGSLPFDAVNFAPFRADPVASNVPACPACGAPLRPHILWFDEFYTDHVDYQFGRALWAARHASVLLFAGTSFSVAITDLGLQQARDRDVEAFAIDPFHQPPAGVRWVRRSAEEALPELVAALARA